MRYKVAIPSYNRPQLCYKTYQNLLNKNITDITIFVQTQKNYQEYTQLFGENTANIILTENQQGIHTVRNTITQYYPDGTPILSIDDDITKIFKSDNNNKLVPIQNWVKLFDYCFDKGGKLWSVNPTGNGFYMNNKTRRGLVFCVGHLHGYINDHNLPPLSRTVKEDYERSILYFEKYGSNTRYDFITTNNVYAKTPGGVGPNRREANKTAAASLIKEYPQYVTYKTGTDEEIKLKKL